jgi:hypothetical protein
VLLSDTFSFFIIQKIPFFWLVCIASRIILIGFTLLLFFIIIIIIILVRIFHSQWKKKLVGEHIILCLNHVKSIFYEGYIKEHTFRVPLLFFVIFLYKIIYFNLFIFNNFDADFFFCCVEKGQILKL